MLLRKLLTAYLNKLYKPMIKSDVIRNRTLDLYGSPGHNVLLDRVCEFLNAEFNPYPGKWG